MLSSLLGNRVLIYCVAGFLVWTWYQNSLRESYNKGFDSCVSQVTQNNKEVKERVVDAIQNAPRDVPDSDIDKWLSDYLSRN